MAEGVKEHLLGFLSGLGCATDDEAVLEYASGVLQSAVDEDDDVEEHLEHLDLLLAGACGERYEHVAQETRYCQLTAIVDEARRSRTKPSMCAMPAHPTTRAGHGAVSLAKQLSGLSAGGKTGSGSNAASSGRRQENVSPAGDTAGVRSTPTIVRELRELCPGAVSEGFLQYALESKFGESAEALAAWLLDSDREELVSAEAAWEDLRQREAREQEEARLLKERNKQHVLQKFDLRPVPEPKDTKKVGKGPALEAWSDKQEKQPKVRYLDGRVVSTKGEKFIVEKTGEEWDGGSRGKVYTKGKRGKGFV